MTNRVFTPFPTLITERLTLRQLLLNDAQNIFALRSDKNSQSSTKLLEKLEFKKSIEPDKTNPDYCVFAFSNKM